MEWNKENWMRLELPSRSENEEFARVAVAVFASRLDPTLEEINDIKTAVSEAVTNSIVHGYADDTGIINIQVEIEENELNIIIKDYGAGIEDIERAREPLFTTKADEERSGMGFTFMEIFMDNLTVESGCGQGTTIHMSKKIMGGK